MIKHKTSLLVSSLLLAQSLPAFAVDVDADSLTGNFYGGIHATYFQADGDRDDAPYTSGVDFESGIGLGLEAGYRIANPFELRLSYSRLKPNNSGVDSLNTLSLDGLYFPTEKSFYLLAGVAGADFEYNEKGVSANVGAGYRHYFTEQVAGYVEGKANYQFDGNYTDGVAQAGFIYFFGTNAKPVEVIEVVEVVIDNDQDGVADNIDQCLSTPINDQVDEMGCTIFAEESLSYSVAIPFDNNKSVVKKEYYGELASTAEVLETYPNIDLTVNGYSSVVGASGYNQALSEKRAKAVAAVLTSEYGIDANRISSVGHGETTEFGASNADNRRIQINILETQKVALERY